MFQWNQIRNHNLIHKMSDAEGRYEAWSEIFYFLVLLWILDWHRFLVTNSFTRCLQVSPMHKKNGDETPYVALCLKLYPYMLEQDHPVNGVFEFSIYNHSNRMYYGCKGSLLNTFIQAHLSYYSWVLIVLFVL
jgi:hypothetical protein